MSSSAPIGTYVPSQPLSSASNRLTAGAGGWPYAASPSYWDDHRQFLRRPLKCRLLLLEDNGSRVDDTSAIPGECINIGNGGLYATVPLGYGVAPGQRYTFRLMIDERGPEPGDCQVVSQQGIIARTELQLGMSGEENRVGMAVRFVGSRSGVIPMPS